MSQIPTFQSSVPIPRPDTSGQQAIAGAIGNVSGQLGELASSLRATHRHTELADSRARTLDEIDKASQDASLESDPIKAEEIFEQRLQKLKETEIESAGSDAILRSQIDAFVTVRGAIAKIGTRNKIISRTIATSKIAAANFGAAIIQRVETGDVDDVQIVGLMSDYESAINAQIGLVHTEESAAANVALFREKLQDANELRLSVGIQSGTNRILDQQTTSIAEGEDVDVAMKGAGNYLSNLATKSIARGLPVDKTADAIINAVTRNAMENENISMLKVMDHIKINGITLSDLQNARDQRQDAALKIGKVVIERDKRLKSLEAIIDKRNLIRIESRGIAMLQADKNADTRVIEVQLAKYGTMVVQRFLTLKTKMETDKSFKDDTETLKIIGLKVLEGDLSAHDMIKSAIIVDKISWNTGINMFNQLQNVKRILDNDPVLNDVTIKPSLSNLTSGIIPSLVGTGFNISGEANIIAREGKARLLLFIMDRRISKPDEKPRAFLAAVDAAFNNIVEQLAPRAAAAAVRRSGKKPNGRSETPLDGLDNR